MARVGLVAPIFQFWDRPSGELVAEFDHRHSQDETRHPFVVQCEQFKTAKLLLERLRGLSNVEVTFGHEVIDVSQNADFRQHRGARTRRRQPPHRRLSDRSRRRAAASWRKQCGIGSRVSPGRSGSIVFTTPYDFETNRGYCPRSYFADPGSWCNCFKVSADGPPGLWRTVFPTDASQPEADVTSDVAVQALMQKFFPQPSPTRCRASQPLCHASACCRDLPPGPRAARRRRCPCQQSDRRHGPHGGIQDAANLCEKLVKVLLDGARGAAARSYNLQRRTVAIEFVQSSRSPIRNVSRASVRRCAGAILTIAPDGGGPGTRAGVPAAHRNDCQPTSRGGTSAADLKFLTPSAANSIGTSNRKSGTRVIELLVPFVSEVRVRGCCKVSRTSETGH